MKDILELFVEVQSIVPRRMYVPAGFHVLKRDQRPPDRLRKLRAEKRSRGECYDCPTAAEPDRTRCHIHLEAAKRK